MSIDTLPEPGYVSPELTTTLGAITPERHKLFNLTAPKTQTNLGVSALKFRSKVKSVLIAGLWTLVVFWAGVNHGHTDLVSKMIASHPAIAETTSTTVPTSGKAPGQ